MKNDSLQNEIAPSLHAFPTISPSGAKEHGGEAALFRRLKSEKGMALIIVLVLSAISLTLMTGLIYMITVGTQSSGSLKRYKTALEASYASVDIIRQLPKLRETSNDDATFQAGLNSFISSLNAKGMNMSVPSVMSGCTGTTKEGKPYTGVAAKVMTSVWAAGCNIALEIKSTDANTYDMKFDMGIQPRYTVYTKIISATEGNTVGNSGIPRGGEQVVAGSSGELPVMPLSSVYTIDVQTENNTTNERVKLQLVYEY